MTYVRTQPQALATAATDVAGIGSAINEAKTAAAGPTTGVVAAAADEVSTAAATLFNTYAQEYQAVLKQLEAFHGAFTRALAAAGNAYAQVEAAASGALIGSAATDVAGATATATAKADPVVDAILIMTPSGNATPVPSYMQNAYNLYLSNYTTLPTTVLTPVSTPEGLYPFTGVKDLQLNISLQRGVTELDNAITQQLGPAPAVGKSVVVLGYSQSTILASLEMPKLLAEGYTSSNASFVLLGDPSNPNGGLLTRFPGLNLPSLGLLSTPAAGGSFGVATPSNDFPTVIYTGEYDGFADFPRYPIDFLADLNALMGIISVHGSYPTLTAAQLNSAIILPQSGAPTMTTYEMIPTPNLPLLDPVRLIPVIGNPIADVLQGPLTPLVNWGYGNPAYGWSTGPADVVTPFGLWPGLSATTALVPAVVSGTQQGIGAAAGALHAGGAVSVPALSLSGISQALTAHPVASALTLPTAASAASTIDNLLLSLEAANTNLVGGFANAFSTAYATLLPTADLTAAVAISIPSYDVNLFLNGIMQAVNGQPLVGLVNAIGDPIAADIGIDTFAGGFELVNIANALQTILTGTPNPGTP